MQRPSTRGDAAAPAGAGARPATRGKSQLEAAPPPRVRAPPPAADAGPEHSLSGLSSSSLSVLFSDGEAAAVLLSADDSLLSASVEFSAASVASAAGAAAPAPAQAQPGAQAPRGAPAVAAGVERRPPPAPAPQTAADAIEALFATLALVPQRVLSPSSSSGSSEGSPRGPPPPLVDQSSSHAPSRGGAAVAAAGPGRTRGDSGASQGPPLAGAWRPPAPAAVPGSPPPKAAAPQQQPPQQQPQQQPPQPQPPQRQPQLREQPARQPGQNRVRQQADEAAPAARASGHSAASSCDLNDLLRRQARQHAARDTGGGGRPIAPRQRRSVALQVGGNDKATQVAFDDARRLLWDGGGLPSEPAPPRQQACWPRVSGVAAGGGWGALSASLQQLRLLGQLEALLRTVASGQQPGAAQAVAAQTPRPAASPEQPAPRQRPQEPAACPRSAAPPAGDEAAAPGRRSMPLPEAATAAAAAAATTESGPPQPVECSWVELPAAAQEEAGGAGVSASALPEPADGAGWLSLPGPVLAEPATPAAADGAGWFSLPQPGAAMAPAAAGGSGRATPQQDLAPASPSTPPPPGAAAAARDVWLELPGMPCQAPVAEPLPCNGIQGGEEPGGPPAAANGHGAPAPPAAAEAGPARPAEEAPAAAPPAPAPAPQQCSAGDTLARYADFLGQGAAQGAAPPGLTAGGAAALRAALAAASADLLRCAGQPAPLQCGSGWGLALGGGPLGAASGAGWESLVRSAAADSLIGDGLHRIRCRLSRTGLAAGGGDVLPLRDGAAAARPDCAAAGGGARCSAGGRWLPEAQAPRGHAYTTLDDTLALIRRHRAALAARVAAGPHAPPHRPRPPRGEPAGPRRRAGARAVP
ncbi:hypothetical protein HT031_004068 [Scenedesmus sp. PABB004]|nr:hypothetical protein HT031_004068 [Scenedesmus sp. PABB004]